MAQDKDNKPVQPPLNTEVLQKQMSNDENILASVQAQLAVLQLEELQQKRKEQQERKDQDQKMRESRNEAIAYERAQKEALQDQCPHRKPNMQPAIVGQRDHRQHYHWLCQYCQKSWIDNELPTGLRISMELVGGPQN